MSYAVVIPVANTKPACKKLITDLLSSWTWGKYPGPLVLCFDNVGKEFKDYVLSISPKDVHVLTHGGDEVILNGNLNYCKMARMGMKYAFEELNSAALISNMDIVLPTHQVVDRIINTGISTCACSMEQGTVVQKFTSLNKKADPGCPCNTSKFTTPPKDVDKLIFFCPFISKYAMSKIGYLDPRFTVTFEDDDYSARCHLAGLPVQEFSNFHVHHEIDRNWEAGEISTTGSYNMNTLITHMDIFKKKWGIPAHVNHPDFQKWIIENVKFDENDPRIVIR